MKRRELLKLAATSAAALAAKNLLPLGPARARATESLLSPDEKFLFVVTANGGGGMLDCFFPVLDSEVEGGKAATLATYTQSQISQPSGSNLRCVNLMPSTGVFSSTYPLENLLKKYYADMALVTVENTSVNHLVAQKRSITGAGIHAGRTIMEATAERWGKNKLIANCNMGAGGYIAAGDDKTVPDWTRGELINSPALFPLATDASRGVEGAPSRELVAHARELREKLEATSKFGQAHAQSNLRKRLLELRTRLASDLMAADLITKLMVIPDSAKSQVAGGLPLQTLGLASSPLGDKIWSAFPNLMSDSLQAQGALGFLLARYGVSSVVTLGPSARPVFLDDGKILGTPISFDYSHVDHVSAQNIMWSRVSMMLDGLISLLKNEPLGSGSMWDRSLIYVATDFGRGRDRPAGATSFGSVHELNNANLFISPMLKGNRIFGGVDKKTLKFFGFDRASGEPAPGTLMREGDLYSLVAHAMDVEFPGRTDMRVALR